MAFSASATLLKVVDDLGLSDARITLIKHSVGPNWRQVNTTTADKLNHLREGLYQSEPTATLEMTCAQFSANPEEALSRTLGSSGLNEVVSCSSRIEVDGRQCHLPLMNLHPELGLSLGVTIDIVNAVTGSMPGYLLSSGRYYHFYGLKLLEQSDWHRFLASWLMPTVIVSPRYIGHCLYRGFATLRLTPTDPHKPVVPSVIATLNH